MSAFKPRSGQVGAWINKYSENTLGLLRELWSDSGTSSVQGGAIGADKTFYLTQEACYFSNAAVGHDVWTPPAHS